MRAAILAGGKGTRMGEIYPDLPKPMFPIAGKPLLQHHIEALALQGIHKITLTVGYKADAIRNHFGDGSAFGVHIYYIAENEPLGTGGALSLLPREDTLILLGDVYFDIDLDKFINFHKEKQAAITLFAHPNSHPHDSDIILTDAENRVTAWKSKNDKQRGNNLPNLANAGLYIFSGDALPAGEAVKCDLDYDLILPAIPKGNVFAYNSTEYVKDMGTPERFAAVKKEVQSRGRKIIILGGGLAGISLAYFLQEKPGIASIDILEKESEPGGLCRSFQHNGITIDIGPHIFFSKDKETLNFMLALLGDNKHELRRSNRIFHKGCHIQYPFENDLSKLNAGERAKCVDAFLHNPYRDYPADNMLQFFLKTFGEGIANLYLRPYNEKIWKFDPAFMDTQMVERIPRPSDEDILRSATGETVDGYTHQLYFSYPKEGGTAAFINAFAGKLNEKVKIHTSCEIHSVQKSNNRWRVAAANTEFEGDLLVSCIPVNILTEIYSGIDEQAAKCGRGLRHNNIIIATATVSMDRVGNNFAFMVADRDVIFHRINKIDFLGKDYHKNGTVTYMMEYTYRDGDKTAALPDKELQERFIDGLFKIGFVYETSEVQAFTLKRFPYAYVIYDLHHRENMKIIREYFSRQGVYLNGRFGNFEYLNMDAVVAESKKMAGIIYE
jgi:protoporphyrinogen oxidase/dTDP-glucose pyrophosphorylase